MLNGKSLPAHKAQLDEYEAEYNQLDSLRKLEERLTASQNMFAWAHVVEVEEVSYMEDHFPYLLANRKNPRRIGSSGGGESEEAKRRG